MTPASLISSQISVPGWASGLSALVSKDSPGAQPPKDLGALQPFVQPLTDWVEQLTGEPNAAAQGAHAWQDASRRLGTIPDLLKDARSPLEELDGRTVRALRARLDDLHHLATDVAEWSAATAAGLLLASRIFDATRDFVCSVLGQLAVLADELLSLTLNPWEIADRVEQFARAAFDCIRVTARLVEDLTEALLALGSLFDRLSPIIADGLRALGQVLARMLPSMGGLVGFTLGPTSAPFGGLLGGAAQNFAQQSADVEELDPRSLSEKMLRIWDESQAVTEITSLTDLVRVNGTTDLLGGSEATVIDIKRVRSADGSEHWIVSLPSTQDWQLLSDAGAVNDRDSNIALMMDNPVLRTVYERAVLSAMRDAGIPPGGDVVLTGFSQGGIMAANLAADSTFPYNTIGVITDGSPVDSFDIPSEIPVYAFQHAADVVPTLDGNAFGETRRNVHRILLPGSLNPVDAHNNSNYADSVDEWEKNYAKQHGGLPPGLDRFTGDVIDHSIFSTHE